MTRAEEWCVEAETADEAEGAPQRGQGYRGDRLHREVETLDDAASFGTRWGGEGSRLILAAASPGRYIHPQIAA